MKLEIGKRYTVHKISGMSALTITERITVKSFDAEGNPLYSTKKHPRTLYRLRLQDKDYESAPLKPFDGAVFLGWDQPITSDTDAAWRHGTGGVMHGNACFNFIGAPAAVREWIDAGQLNEAFNRGHVMAFEGDADPVPVYPEIETSHAVINRAKAV